MIQIGDRYDITVKCAYCKAPKDTWYAPTSGCMTFKCGKCKKNNFVTMKVVTKFEVKKIEDTTLEDVKDAFSETTTASRSEEEENEICQDMFEQIKKAG